MPDPDLTATNCTGATCSITLGLDPTSLTPNQLLAVLNKDERTIECAEGVGVRVKICDEASEIPDGFRTADACGNMLRVQSGAGPEVADCGLVVLAPLVAALSNGTRETIPQNVDPDGPDGPLEPAPLVLGPISKSIVLQNDDSCARMYTIYGLASCITEVGTTNYQTAEMQVAIRTESTLPMMGGVTVRERVTTLIYPPAIPNPPGPADPADGDYEGRTVNDRRDIIDSIILQPGQNVQLDYRARTIRSLNMVGAGANRGFLFSDIRVRSEQVRIA